MAYTKNTWACGDEITADKLNHIEEGIENAGGGAGALFVTLTEGENNSYTADKTVAELIEAINNGIMCYAKVPVASNGTYGIVPAYSVVNEATVTFTKVVGGTTSSGFNIVNDQVFGSSTPNGDMWMVMQESVDLQIAN